MREARCRQGAFGESVLHQRDTRQPAAKHRSQAGSTGRRVPTGRSKVAPGGSETGQFACARMRVRVRVCVPKTNWVGDWDCGDDLGLRGWLDDWTTELDDAEMTREEAIVEISCRGRRRAGDGCGRTRNDVADAYNDNNE